MISNEQEEGEEERSETRKIEIEDESEEDSQEGTIVEEKHNHFSPLRMMKEFDNIFNAFKNQFDNHFWHPFRPYIIPHVLRERARKPPLDIQDTDGSYILNAEIPGVSKEEIEITLDPFQIIIHAEYCGEKEMEENETPCYICQERSRNAYHRVLKLPEEIDLKIAEATLENGVLTIVLPKKIPTPKTEPRKLEIQ